MFRVPFRTLPQSPLAACLRYLTILPTTALTILLASCANYDVTLNDQVVYTPAELYKEYQISDNGLRSCVERAITQNRIIAAEQLVELNCINAGIVSLAGLERFTELQYLDLSGNFELQCPKQEQLAHVEQLYLPATCR